MQFCPNGNPPCYKSKEEDVVIAAEDKIRLKIVGTRVDATGIVSYSALQCAPLALFFENVFFSLPVYSLPLARSWTIIWVWLAANFYDLFIL